MSISGVNGASTSAVYTAAASTKSASAAVPEEVAPQTTADVDSYIPSATQNTGNTYKPNTAKLAELDAGEKAYIQGLQDVVSQLVRQVGQSQTANGGVPTVFDASKVESVFDVLVENPDGTYDWDPSLTTEDKEKLIAKAKEDVGEEGYYGVKQTSTRILDYAKAITGGDPAKIDDMRKMAQEAFDSVKEMYDGKLPELSQKTYDAVMKGFDEWAAASSKGATVVS